MHDRDERVLKAIKVANINIYSPWNNRRPARFMPRPMQPTINTNLGFSIETGVMNRSMASRTMVKQSANRKTELTSAPIISLLWNPYVLLEDFLVLNLRAEKAMTSAKTSDNYQISRDKGEGDEPYEKHRQSALLNLKCAQQRVRQ